MVHYGEELFKNRGRKAGKQVSVPLPFFPPIPSPKKTVTLLNSFFEFV
jgi:hypothetical protein